jgi:hypothetical protein
MPKPQPKVEFFPWQDGECQVDQTKYDLQKIEIEGCGEYSVVKNPDVTMEGDSQKIDEISGMKVWESSEDLVSYLGTKFVEEQKKKNRDWSETRILEIGCGHGLPGMWGLKQGCKVDFQDYSADTLKHVTKVNVPINCSQEQCQRARFFSAEWSELIRWNLEQEDPLRYDVIVAAECCYDEKSFETIIDMLDQLLDVNGVAFISGKRFYFGCGGGTAAFADAVDKFVDLKQKEVWVCENGMSNVREIIQVTRKHNPRLLG